MADDKGRIGPADRSRVSVNERYELEYWSEHFGVTRDTLKAAVADVGVMVADVEKYLKSKRRTNSAAANPDSLRAETTPPPDRL